MLNIAVIGAGRIGHVHAKTIASHPDAKLALIADPFGDAAEKLAAEYGAAHTTDVDSAPAGCRQGWQGSAVREAHCFGHEGR